MRTFPIEIPSQRSLNTQREGITNSTSSEQSGGLPRYVFNPGAVAAILATREETKEWHYTEGYVL